MTHVVYVTRSLLVGGAERHLSLVAPRLKADGFDVTLVCIYGGGPFERTLENTGVRLILFRHAEIKFFPFRMAWFVWELAKLFVWLLRERPEIVHTFLPAPYILTMPLAILARIPIRLMSRRGRANYSYRRPIARRIELFLHRHISGAFGNSSIVVEDLRNERIQEDKLHLVYNGIEVDQFHPRENTEAEQNVADPVTFVCLANLNYYKGHSDLIQALSRVSDELPTAWQMLFVGRDDGEGDSLRALCAELNLQEHVQFLGERSDVPDILRTADIGVLASHEEGFSNAVIECMASGLPMVVSDVGGNAEAVTADAGYVVPPSDVPRLSVALLTMARSNDRAKMSKAACERVEQNYTIEACVKAYEAIYLLYLSRLHR